MVWRGQDPRVRDQGPEVVDLRLVQAVPPVPDAPEVAWLGQCPRWLPAVPPAGEELGVLHPAAAAFSR